MRTALAEKLLVRIMHWSPEEVQKERPLLQALANFKYDEYQQYSPGMRFIESLVRWLRQFEKIEEKSIAYNFIKTNLIFFSGEQILHLVSLAFSEKVKPLIIENTALELSISKYHINEIVESDAYKRNLRQTLFIGLSDGSKIDYFRRVSRINNESVSPTYEIADTKVTDMLDKLKKEINVDKFNSIVLIDDFTASGKSYFREEEDGTFAGKICKFLNSLINDDMDNYISTLVDKNFHILILFYVATDEAINTIKELINKWMSINDLKIKVDIEAIQFIKEDVKEDVLKNPEFIKLAEKYFDNSILTKHYMVGKHTKPYLGFNECTLPLVLNHNTPNNSLPILWFPESLDNSLIGLFPRISRH